MPTTQGVYTNRIKYSLLSKEYGSLIGATEPLNWDSDEKTLQRSKRLHGVFTRFSNDLTFTEDAAEFIEQIYRGLGINAVITVVREERDPITDVFTETYKGELDLSKYKKEENGNITVRFNSGGIEKIRKSRQNVKVELERLDTIDGEIIPELDIKKVALNGRDIFLTSEVRQETERNYELFSYYSKNLIPSGADTNARKTALAPTAELIYESDDQVNAVIYSPIAINVGTNLIPQEYQDGTTGNMFYAVATEDKTLNLRIDVKFSIYNISTYGLTNTVGNLKLFIAKYNNGVSYDFDSLQEIHDFGNAVDGLGSTLEFQTNIDFDILQDESIALILQQELQGPPVTNNIKTKFTVNKWLINIDESSVKTATQSNVILAHEAAERILKIITGEDKVFYSSLLGGEDIGYEQDGTARYTGLSHGYWVRGYEKGDNLYKSITTSWSDFFKSIDAIYNVGLGIETIEGKKRFVLEDKKYFYSRNVTVRLGAYDEYGTFIYTQIENAVRTVADQFYFSDLEIGFAKGGDYEEAMGLDEYNIKSQFTTVIKALENSYQKLSRYRGDSYGKELARRKQKAEYPTEDTAYDNDIFIQDLKKGETEVLLERFWQDDFEEEPIGVYSPQTATNLRYSPFNCFLRHAWFIAGGQEMYSDDFIKYASSESNSQLVTKLKATLYPDYGGVQRPENGSIKIKDIKGIRFYPEKLTFNSEVDFNLLRQLEGSTTLPNGKKIPNLNGLIEYKNEKGQIERAYLNKLKPNSGEWEVLTANY